MRLFKLMPTLTSLAGNLDCTTKRNRGDTLLHILGLCLSGSNFHQSVGSISACIGAKRGRLALQGGIAPSPSSLSDYGQTCASPAYFKPFKLFPL